MRRLVVAGVALSVVVAYAVGCGGGDHTSCSPVGSGAPDWMICDLGTLGGESSEAVAMNDRGEVVGSAETGEHNSRGGSISHAFLWENGKMRDLGTLGGESSEAVAINERGQVVGSADTPLRDANGNQIKHAFLWENGKMHDLGTLAGFEGGSRAVGINARDQVVGSSVSGKMDKQGRYVWHAFLWASGRMTDLGTLGGIGGISSAEAINARGQVLGLSFAPGGARAFLWEKGRMTNLGTLPGGYNTYPGAINDQGQIVGRASVSTHYWHAFLWEHGRMTDLLIPPADRDSGAAAINNRGQIVATSVGRVLLWERERSTDLRIQAASEPILFNDRDQIAGTNTHAHAFIWEKGRMHDLGVLGGDFSRAMALNEHEQVVGTSDTSSASQPHAVLWTLKSGT